MPSVDKRVFVVSRPTVNKFGFTPNLSSAQQYGRLEIVFEQSDNPQFLPGPAVRKAFRVLRDFDCQRDAVLWAGGGDPTAVGICFAVLSSVTAAQRPQIITMLRWERTLTDNGRDRKSGFYVPVPIELAKKDINNEHG